MINTQTTITLPQCKLICLFSNYIPPDQIGSRLPERTMCIISKTAVLRQSAQTAQLGAGYTEFSPVMADYATDGGGE